MALANADPRLDTGEDVVSPYLWNQGIHRLDIVVATHAHEDHIGGLAAILENFHPRELWTGANPQQALLDRAARLHIRSCNDMPNPLSTTPEPASKSSLRLPISPRQVRQ